MVEQRKLVVVNDRTILNELGGIGGPIVAPTLIPLSTIRKMVISGKTVYECSPNDPRNESVRVKLTLQNVDSNNFQTKVIENEMVHPASVVEPEKVNGVEKGQDQFKKKDKHSKNQSKSEYKKTLVQGEVTDVAENKYEESSSDLTK